MASKIKIFSQNLALWEGHFYHFLIEKSLFFGLFESCFGVVQKLFMHRFEPLVSPLGSCGCPTTRKTEGFDCDVKLQAGERAFLRFCVKFFAFIYFFISSLVLRITIQNIILIRKYWGS